MKKLLKFFSTYGVTVLITVITVLFGGLLALYGIGITPAQIPSRFKLMQKLNIAYNEIEKHYYYDANADELTDAALNGIASALDDDGYTAYYDSAKYEEKQADLNSEAKGIGIVFAYNSKTNQNEIIYVNSESPAQKAGLAAGDILLSINGENISNMETQEIYTAVQANYGDKIKITAKRAGKTLDFEVEVTDYISDTVRYSLYGDIAIFKITSFKNTTVEQFKTALKQAENDKIKGIVFDLRNNPGGTVDSCAGVLDILLPQGNTVVSKNKQGKLNVMYRSDTDETDLPMAVVVNENTASAAEIFALNIRDFEKGKIFGVKTYGKGIMQTTYSLAADGSSIKFTTAEVVDKNGNTYHKKGIVPDKTVTLTEAQINNFNFLTPSEDTQLYEAIKSLKQ